MNILTYYTKSGFVVDCPECGLPTSYLEEFIKDGEKVLKCEDCLEEE